MSLRATGAFSLAFLLSVFALAHGSAEGTAFAGDGRHGSIIMNSSFGGRWGV
jgi:hypothetical protein